MSFVWRIARCFQSYAKPIDCYNSVGQRRWGNREVQGMEHWPPSWSGVVLNRTRKSSALSFSHIESQSKWIPQERLKKRGERAGAEQVTQLNHPRPLWILTKFSDTNMLPLLTSPQSPSHCPESWLRSAAIETPTPPPPPAPHKGFPYKKLTKQILCGYLHSLLPGSLCAHLVEATHPSELPLPVFSGFEFLHFLGEPIREQIDLCYWFVGYLSHPRLWRTEFLTRVLMNFAQIQKGI